MKKNGIYIIAIVCAIASFFGCSNDNDAILDNNQIEKKGVSTIVVGAPTITSEGSNEAKTRANLSYEDSKLKVQFAANDNLVIRSYKLNSNSDGWTQVEGPYPYTTEAGGDNATFTGTEFTREDATSWLFIHPHAEGVNTVSSWNSEEIATEQTQSGNDNTSHLKSNYTAILQYVNTNTNVEFSGTWADNHQVSEHGTAATGKFAQSACLKLDLTLPVLSVITKIKKVVLSSSNDAFYISNATSGSAKKTTNTITLNFTGVTGISGNTSAYNLIGYFMLSAGGLNFTKDAVLTIKVYYGDNADDYIYRDITFTSATSLEGGQLGVIKVNKNWKGIYDTANKITFTFNSAVTQQYKGDTNPASTTISSITQEGANKLYMKYGASDGTAITITELASDESVQFTSGTNAIAASKYAVISTDDGVLSKFKGALGDAYREASWVNNYCRETLALDVTQAGTLFIYAKSESNPADGRLLGTTFQINNKKGYTENTTAVSKTGFELKHNSTGAGTFHIYSSDVTVDIYAIEFLPYK